MNFFNALVDSVKQRFISTKITVSGADLEEMFSNISVNEKDLEKTITFNSTEELKEFVYEQTIGSDTYYLRERLNNRIAYALENARIISHKAFSPVKLYETIFDKIDNCTKENIHDWITKITDDEFILNLIATLARDYCEENNEYLSLYCSTKFEIHTVVLSGIEDVSDNEDEHPAIVVIYIKDIDDLDDEPDDGLDDEPDDDLDDDSDLIDWLGQP